MIEIDNTNCTGTPSVSSVTGDFAVRHLGMVNALLYGGSVRSFEPTDIDLADTTHEPLVIWWLPDREHGFVCGSVVVIDNPNEPPEPSGTEPDATLEPDSSEPDSTPEPSGSEPPEPADCVAYVKIVQPSGFLHVGEVEVIERGSGVNLALGATATQSSTHTQNGTGILLEAPRAIDGDPDTFNHTLQQTVGNSPQRSGGWLIWAEVTMWKPFASVIEARPAIVRS